GGRRTGRRRVAPERVRKGRRARRLLTQKLNREPLLAEVAKEAGLPERRVQQLLDLVQDPGSLETPVGDGESSFAELIEDENAEQPAEATAVKLRHGELANALEQLDPRMR